MNRAVDPEYSWARCLKGLLIGISYVPVASADFSFEDVTIDAGMYNESKGWCAAWGDYNGDGWPDLYVNNHQLERKLYLNLKNGSFAEISSDVFDYRDGQELKDSHGCIWLDFDNDGDKDLAQVSGGNGGREEDVPVTYNEFFVNENGALIDKAVEMDIAYPAARGRSVSALDYDSDGQLDLFYGTLEYSNNVAPSKIYHQNAGVYVESTLELGLEISGSVDYSQLSDVYGDRGMELLVNGKPQLHVYNFENLSVADVTSQIILDPANLAPRDVVLADLNNDLIIDIFKPRGVTSVSSVSVRNESEFGFYISAEAEIPEKKITFQTDGDITFNSEAPWNPLTDVFIGDGGWHPTDWVFSLASGDPNTHGLLEYSPGTDRGIYIGFDTDENIWTIALTSPSVLLAAADSFTGILTSTHPITNIQTFGFDPSPPSGKDNVFLGSAGGFFEKVTNNGIEKKLPSNAAVIGDFDNDSDKDIYVVESSYAGNEPNVLYENIGGGQFVEVPDAGGASGTIMGIGASVATADFDQDGFLDIYFVNGKGAEPLAIGPDQLFRNMGNGNHWLQIDLEGIKSNRDAIGSKVYVSSGGVTQLVEQNGATQFNSQNYQRLHFGLGVNEVIDSVKVEWPTGLSQTITDIPADQIIQILENSTPALGGKPVYQTGIDEGIFIWKDSYDGPYHLRVNGSGVASAYEIKLVSTDAILDVAGVNLETGDKLIRTTTGFTLTARADVGQDGVDFTMPSGAKALLSATKNGVSNPRDIHVGGGGDPLMPSGWLFNTTELPQRPTYRIKSDSGLFVGRAVASNQLEAQYNGGGVNHTAKVSLIGSEPFIETTRVKLEPADIVVETASSIEIEGHAEIHYDGVTVIPFASSDIGIAYQQDGLFQTRKVNPGDGSLGPYNAYWLPVTSESGNPHYDPSSQRNLFLWKDESETWHLRATAGYGNLKYVGTITATAPYANLTPYSLEAADVLDASIGTEIHFSLNVSQPWEDGFDFSFPAGTEFTLELLNNTSADADLVKIGEQMWAIEHLPLKMIQ